MNVTRPQELSAPSAAYAALDARSFRASALTRGPRDPGHQHAGPPIALVCRAVEQAAHEHGLTHVARLTANLLRPVPIGDVVVEVMTDYVGRNAGHFSAHLLAGGKEVARFTALVQRESAAKLPADLPGHPLPMAPRTPEESPVVTFPFAGAQLCYADLVETRAAQGMFWKGPCAIWFRQRHPLVEGETPSPYQRVPVAADSGNGISGVLDYRRHSFVNSDLTINLLRRPVGEWICLDARTALGPDGGGLAESALYDVQGFIGRATQSLAVRLRSG
ncbi:MAG: thioesterase family protein [Lautropia sp.]|nr:MAG: thioesterase family protein [Pseudomonadota bacterium]MBC6959778.1 thioesterase family protein [Lautropia sp.]MCL4702084.1 thioesterase family protein [Burkholderiaceae bacterium]MDL1908185.1 thioesterase family protein [Betaproteobacteria bacterium PRO1]RIK89174.1 MAG: thioesterase family protein [Burkholderiales bacterium]